MSDEREEGEVGAVGAERAVLFVRMSRIEKERGEELARRAGVTLPRLVRMWLWRESERDER